MKRSGFDERRDQQIANDYLTGHMACSFCNAQTPKEELNTLSARCRPCYDAYCRGDRDYPRLTPQDRRDMAGAVRAALGGRLRLPGAQHIAQLQRRADAGEALSPGQRGFLQAVRRASGIVDEPQPAPVQAAAGAVHPALPAAMHPHQAGRAEAVDDVPPWVLDEIPLPEDVARSHFPADDGRISDPNRAEAAC